jgi:competence ComEA-like helix-hairpin-helix protein
MKLIRYIARLVAFTDNEKRILIVLGAGLVIGIAIAAYQGHRAELDIPDFSEIYAHTDSVFHERSARIPKPGGTDAPPLALLAEGSININTASKEELTLLPGIGDVFAERIILYREDNGAFESDRDLLNVSGIGERRLEIIRPYITY